MDNPWLGTMKQWGGRLIAPLYVRPAFDLAFIPGERQAAFARRLGFPPDAIRWGLYSCGDDYFIQPNEAATGARFLFVGRLVESKGVTTLADAYDSYRRSVERPWPLLVAGTGPLSTVLEQIPGVEMLGFVQPADLPQLFRESGCLVLPSWFEPWGVVIHEAVASGLPVICSDSCGASTRLAVDGLNGRVVPPGHSPALLDAMVAMSSQSPTQREQFGRASRSLADQFTPQRWAEYVLERM